MNCQLCGKRPAAIHYTELSGSSAVEYHICQECAQEKGLFKPVGGAMKFSVTDFLAGMGTSGTAPDPNAALRCPVCGETWTEFREGGRLGCEACYDAFAEPLRALLRRIHGSTQHAGKRSAVTAVTAPDRATEVVRLREELRRALEREDFERCAELRDEIRKAEEAAGSS